MTHLCDHCNSAYSEIRLYRLCDRSSAIRYIVVSHLCNSHYTYSETVLPLCRFLNNTLRLHGLACFTQRTGLHIIPKFDLNIFKFGLHTPIPYSSVYNTRGIAADPADLDLPRNFGRRFLWRL